MSTQASPPITMQRFRSGKRVALWPFRRALLPWALRTPPSRAKLAALDRVVMPQLRAQGLDFEKQIDERSCFVGNTRDLGSLLIYLFGTYEPAITRFVRSRLRPGDTFIDVGANVGWFTVLAGRQVGPEGMVISVEPSPRLLPKLRANIAANGLTNVRVVEAAAGESEGRVDVVQVPEENTGWTWVRPGTQVPRDTLPKLVGDDVWRAARLIKVDVEGSEFDIVAGAAAQLPLLDASAEIVMEVCTDPNFGPRTLDGTAGRDDAVAALFKSMADAGFHPYRITNPYDLSDYVGDAPTPTLSRAHGVPESGGDFVFSRVDAPSLPL